MINHNDKALRKNVLETAFYLVKRDYLIRSVMFNSKYRAFSRGQNPEKSKSGRPRKESIKGFEMRRIQINSDTYHLKKALKPCYIRV